MGASHPRPPARRVSRAGWGGCPMPRGGRTALWVPPPVLGLTPPPQWPRYSPSGRSRTPTPRMAFQNRRRAPIDSAARVLCGYRFHTPSTGQGGAPLGVPVRSAPRTCQLVPVRRPHRRFPRRGPHGAGLPANRGGGRETRARPRRVAPSGAHVDVLAPPEMRMPNWRNQGKP
jgi:hypothetical protein